MPRTSNRWVGEIYMILRDRKKLARLMVIQEVSQRELAGVAGYKAHSYIGRLLRGEEKTLKTDAALRIAHHLRVPVDDLFLIKVASNSVQPGHKSEALCTSASASVRSGVRSPSGVLA